MRLEEAKRYLNSKGYRLVENRLSEANPSIEEVIQMLEGIGDVNVKDNTIKDPNVKDPTPKINVGYDGDPYVGVVEYSIFTDGGDYEWKGYFWSYAPYIFKAAAKSGKYDIDFDPNDRMDLDDFIERFKLFKEICKDDELVEIGHRMYSGDEYDYHSQFYDGKHYNGD